jgi:UDP-N-acetylglucosamine:LPS N-acetylglucosamine transferase
VKSVLILTAGFGEGHNAAARNLRDALADVAPEVRVEVHDILADVYGALNRLAVAGYLAVINRAPAVWDFVFRWLDQSTAVRDGAGLLGGAARRLRAVVARLRPGVIVTTYPGYVPLLNPHCLGEEAPYVTLVTDSLTINSVWYSDLTHAYLVANEETAKEMARAGVPESKMKVLGFPVPLVFADIRDAKTEPAPGERWTVLFMVNSGKRIALEVVRELSGMPDIDLLVTVGRDAALEQRIRDAVRNCEHVRVLGWTPELPRLMAEAHVVVTKAGGATVQECLAARTPLIISQVVPGQEEGNARLVTRAGAGVIAESAPEIADALRGMIAAGGREWRAWSAAARALGRPDAARENARWLVEEFSLREAPAQSHA